MTDLENLWDDLATGKPPVDEIVRAGRLQAGRRRRLIVRPLIVTGSVAALCASFAVGTRVAGIDVKETPPVVDARAASFQADLDPAQSCSELLSSYHDRGVAQVSAWGWRSGRVFRTTGLSSVMKNSSSKTAQLQAARASLTGTNVQEATVDEPDTVKTDGSRIVRMRGSNVITYTATDAGVRKLSSLHLPRIAGAEILLAGDAVIAIGADTTSPIDDITGERRGSRVLTISLNDPTRPRISSDVTYSARVLSARQHGATVRLVLSSGLPDLDFTEPRRSSVTGQQALEANRSMVEASTITDWLPTFDDGTGPRPLLNCTDVAVASEDLALDTISIVGIDVNQPTAPQSIGLASATEIAYESADHLYLAASAPTGTSYVFDFELEGINARHIASGEVEGTIADRWSLDEAHDVLRIAVGPSSETGNFNSLVTLKREGTDLVESGRLDQLGPDEEIKSVRWFDDMAIIVTFREVDPLFTVDLSNPAVPTLLGKLKIPGYSDYLHPLGDDQLLGIGDEGNGQAGQIALFDIADLGAVTRQDVLTFKGYHPVAGQDPRAFTWLPERGIALTVLHKDNAAYLATVIVGEGTLVSQLARVEYGNDTYSVRTIELADGRVALVTGEDVRLLELP